MNIIQFKFGDPSNDGHGQFENFFAVVNRPLAEVEEAYAIAEKKFHLMEIAEDYESTEISTDAFLTLSEAGFDFKLDRSDIGCSNFLLEDNIVHCNGTDGIKEITMFVLKKILPNLEMMIVKIDTIEMPVGYGLFHEG